MSGPSPALQISEAEESAQELLEDIEPDAQPIPAKKPPPPPTKAQRERKPEVAEESPIKKAKPWFEDLFSEDYIKTMDVLPEEDVRREVDFIEEKFRQKGAKPDGKRRDDTGRSRDETGRASLTSVPPPSPSMPPPAPSDKPVDPLRPMTQETAVARDSAPGGQ